MLSELYKMVEKNSFTIEGTTIMKRTLMLKNQELLDFEVDPVTSKIRILDAPDADDTLLSSLGFGGSDLRDVVEAVIRGRRMSANRDDIDKILDAFNARSVYDLAFMGHGLSLSDKLWYRAPGSTERWEDVNFLDNAWDNAFCESVLTGDFKRLASCSPDVPDVTTGGDQRKAWEQTEDGIRLLKDSSYEHRADLEGELLAAELCSLLYGKDAYQPLSIVECYGGRFSASPLMVGRDEELIQGLRMFSMCGFDVREARKLTGPVTSQDFIDIISRAGVANASEHVAKIFAFKALALLHDLHAGNYGIIRNIETGACRATLPFDYDHAFGFPNKEFPFEFVCNNPDHAAFLCAISFSDLESSWDWDWYDPNVLEGFEERIVKAYAPFSSLPPNFGDLVARLFAMQRDYVNKVASKA